MYIYIYVYYVFLFIFCICTYLLVLLNCDCISHIKSVQVLALVDSLADGFLHFSRLARQTSQQSSCTVILQGLYKSLAFGAHEKRHVSCRLSCQIVGFAKSALFLSRWGLFLFVVCVLWLPNVWET